MQVLHVEQVLRSYVCHDSQSGGQSVRVSRATASHGGCKQLPILHTPPHLSSTVLVSPHVALLWGLLFFGSRRAQSGSPRISLA